MIPEWFSPDEVPYEKMFEDDRHWIGPLFLGENSKKFAGRADYGKADEGQYTGKLLRWWFGTYE
jgi:8-oxo-dGTP diphosphatase / 2-hydroxy-dATP diphosphatase